MDRELEERRIVRRIELSQLTGLARATIYKKVDPMAVSRSRSA